MTASREFKNLLTDIPGLLVGQAHDETVRTGVSVVVPEAGSMRMAVDQRGGGPGTTETDLLRLENTVDTVNALVLSGGSAFGLAAADEVRLCLAEEGCGFPVGGFHIPIVPGAILFDLLNGGQKDWEGLPPYRQLARQAFTNRKTVFDLGNAGAGYGAMAGVEKGGLGSASFQDPETGYSLAALIAVNPVGSVYCEEGVFWGWPFLQAQDGIPLKVPSPAFRADPMPDFRKLTQITETGATGEAGNTTIGLIATDAPLSAADLKRLAIMAQDGLARAIRPIHTPLDGDTLFAASVSDDLISVDPLTLGRLGAIAADCVTRSVMRGVFFGKPF